MFQLNTLTVNRQREARTAHTVFVPHGAGCASLNVYAWLTVKYFEIATFAKPQTVTSNASNRQKYSYESIN